MSKKLLGWIIGILLFILGLVLGDVKIELGTYSPQANTKTVVKQLGNLQNIS